MSEVVYRVKDLVRKYGALTAVDHVSFDAYAGECLGLLGPNGAGKSTTVEIMEGISRPTSGTVRYREQPLDDHFRQSVGIMFQSTALPEFIYVREVLNMFANLYHRHCDLDRLIEQCAIGDFLNQATHRLSGGQRQRLLLAIALINDPEIIFLDEPTTGLDPTARQNLWDVIGSAKQQGKTVVLTTHYMEEAYQLCDRIILMNHGRIVAQGAPSQLLSQQFGTTVLVLPKSGIDNLPTLYQRLSEDDDFSLTDDQREIHLECTDVNAALGFLIGCRVDLQNLQIRKKNLNDLFFKLTENLARPD